MAEAQERGYVVIVLAGQDRLPNEEQIIRHITKQGLSVDVVRSVDELLQVLSLHWAEFVIIIADFDSISDGRSVLAGESAQDGGGPFHRIYAMRDRIYAVRDVESFAVIYLVHRELIQQTDVFRSLGRHVMDCRMCVPVDPAELARMVSRIRWSVDDERGYDVRM